MLLSGIGTIITRHSLFTGISFRVNAMVCAFENLILDYYYVNILQLIQLEKHFGPGSFLNIFSSLH